MSIKAAGIWAPSPSTERGKSTQLSVDSKGERLAYANNKSIFLRSIDDPAVSTQYTQHTATTTVARFAPSGYYIASGDVTGTVKVWDCVGEGATKGSYQITRSITDLAWDGDSQRIIAVGDGKERFGHCISWDSGNTVGEITGHSAQINSVSIRQQRPLRAVTGSDDTSLVFFHGAPFKFNTSLRGQHNRFVYGVAFSPDGSTLVSVGADKKICIYDGKTGEVKGQIGDGEHKGSIFAVSWAKDSKRFVTSSADQTVKIWDVEAGRSIQTWRLSEEGDVSVPDHQVGVAWPNRSDGLILSLSLSGNINYLAEGTPKPRRILYGHQKNITTLASFPSPPTLWTGSSDGRICNWDVSSGTGDTVDGEQHSNYVSGLSLTPSSLSTVGWDDTLRTIDTSARTFTGTKESTEGQPIGVVTLENGTTITTTHKGIQVFKPGSTTVYLPTPNFSPTSVSATTSLIAVGGDDGALHIYTISSSSLSELTKIPSSSGSGPTVLSFSPDGSKLAAGFSNGKISVYDVSSTKGAEWDISISRWSAHTGRVSSIVWRKDGKFAVSGALDTNVFVWSVDKPGKRIKAEGAHKEGVNAVGWVGESKVVTAGMDAAIRVWDVGGLE